jgi:hypothetical protein
MLLDQETGFIGFREDEDKVSVMRELGGELHAIVLQLVLDRDKLPLEVAVEHDLSIIKLGHDESEAVVVTVLIMLNELTLNLKS